MTVVGQTFQAFQTFLNLSTIFARAFQRDVSPYKKLKVIQCIACMYDKYNIVEDNELTILHIPRSYLLSLIFRVINEH